MKEILKRLLLVTSVLWCFGAVYFFYSTTYAILSLDWARFSTALLVMAAITLTHIAVAIAADK